MTINEYLMGGTILLAVVFLSFALLQIVDDALNPLPNGCDLSTKYASELRTAGANVTYKNVTRSGTPFFHQKTEMGFCLEG